MMGFSYRFVPIGGLVRRMVRIIPLMYFVIYLLEINKSYLMKKILVVNNKIICLREKEIRSTRIGDT